MRVAMVLGLAVWLWPAMLGAALADRLDGATSLVSGGIYLAASRVCHQRSERSFHTHGYQWPVCARCSGLYLAAPAGVLLAAGGRRRSRATLARLVVLAALPMAGSWTAEAIAGMPVSAAVRAVTAAPLGATVAFALFMLVRRADRIG